jgi:hypothetical protein
MIAWLARLIGGGALDRAFDLVDRKLAQQQDRERLKADLIEAHYRTQADRLRAGLFWLMLPFVLCLAFWFAAVVIYSVFWCAGCAYPQSWTIAALPPPLDEWAGAMITALFGVVGVAQFRR